MDRFHIIVFNYEHISSFLNNFNKIVHFNPEIDKIFIMDSSVNYKSQQKEVVEFVQKNGLILGEQIHFIQRKNWGLAEGGRIDYFSFLHQSTMNPKYIWQFQDHYLDLESPWSINKEGTINVDGTYIGGQIKGDVIPDGLIIDLNVCEKIYETHSEVSIIYADRLKIGICPYADMEFFYIDGANCSLRTSYALHAFDQNFLETCKLIYDPTTYNWAVFMEFKWGFQITKKGSYFYDLVSKRCFNHPQSLRDIEYANNICLHQSAEDYYQDLYKKYDQQYLLFANSHLLSQKFYQGIFLVKTLPGRFKKALKVILNQFGLWKVTKTL